MGAFLSGAALLVMSARQLPRFFMMRAAAQTVDRNEPLTSWLHLLFIGVSVLFGLLQLVLSPLLFKGSRVFSRAPALYLVSTVWGMVNLFFMFVYYSHGVLRQENAYLILSACLLLLALYYLSRYFAGVGKERSARYLYVFGFPGVMLTVVYTASNLLIYFLPGGRYSLTSVPLTVQAAQLAMAVFVFISLVTIRKYDLHEPAGARRMKHRHYTPQKRQAASFSGTDSPQKRAK